MPEESKKKLAEVHPEETFKSSEGKEIRSLAELYVELESITPEAFGHHVSEHKNDYANWIQDSVGDETLALELRKTNDLEETKKIVAERIDELKKRIHMGDIIKKINSFNFQKSQSAQKVEQEEQGVSGESSQVETEPAKTDTAEANMQQESSNTSSQSFEDVQPSSGDNAESDASTQPNQSVNQSIEQSQDSSQPVGEGSPAVEDNVSDVEVEQSSQPAGQESVSEGVNAESDASTQPNQSVNQSIEQSQDSSQPFGEGSPAVEDNVSDVEVGQSSQPAGQESVPGSENVSPVVDNVSGGQESPQPQSPEPEQSSQPASQQPQPAPAVGQQGQSPGEVGQPVQSSDGNQMQSTNSQQPVAQGPEQTTVGQTSQQDNQQSVLPDISQDIPDVQGQALGQTNSQQQDIPKPDMGKATNDMVNKLQSNNTFGNNYPNNPQNNLGNSEAKGKGFLKKLFGK